MKKICFLMDSLFTFGGVQRVTAVVAKQLAATCDVTIVTFDRPDQEDTSLYGLSEARISYRYVSYPQTSWLSRKVRKVYSGLYRKLRLQSQWASDLYARSSFPKKLRLALASELAKGGYDTIVGVHAPLAARLSTLSPLLPGTRLVGWIHNSFEALYGDTSLYIGAELKRHYVYQLRRLDSVVVLCRHDAECYTAYDPALHPTVIYNPLTLQPGTPSAGTSKRFLAVGRFSRRHKGFDLLIQAFHLFAEQNTDWQLDIVGEGVEEPLYRSLISQYGLQDRVTIHPFTPDIQQYYSAAQVYVLSSRWEGFGLVLVEAMAHGLPVVSSDLPTSLEIMGDFGLYFRNGNVQELAQRLTDATRLDWPAKSAEAIDRAHRFDTANIIAQWREVL